MVPGTGDLEEAGLGAVEAGLGVVEEGGSLMTSSWRMDAKV